MARWQAAVVVAVLFLCLLLVTAPARLLGYFLPSQQLLLQGFKGSLWHGSADSAALAVSGGYLQLGRLQWDLSPWSLLVLSPRAELETRWGRQTLVADISVSPNRRIRLHNASLDFPARLIRQWLPVQLRGSFNLLIEDLSLRDLRPDAGSGRLVWRGARWIGNTSRQD
ncbi:MAG: type II secretion system protein N, partial [Gammaproteobacteria bacterium]|nr:type II secretion system protein N [Gammaproteobacteria bacterium]